MLLASLLPVVLLAEFLAVIVDFGIVDLGLPVPLGGVLIAILVLAPEGLTIPAVLAIGLVTGRDVELGLTQVETVLLILTLFVSGLTFGGGHTNVLQGVVHLLLFVIYVMLIFSP